MNITKNQIDDLNLVLKIELGKEDYAGGVDGKLNDLRKKAIVDGFRKGKVPLGIIKRMYGQSVLVEELNKKLNEALTAYIKDNDLNILGEPLPDEDAQKDLNLEGESFEFFYDIALAPEVNVEMTKREKLPYYTIIVDVAMLEKQIAHIRKSNGSMQDVDTIEGTEYLTGKLEELDDKGGVKAGGISNPQTSMSVSHMKDESSAELFKGKKIGDEVVFNPSKAYPNKTDFSAMLGISKEEAENVDSDFKFSIESIRRFVDADINQALYDKLYGEGNVKTDEEFRERVKEDVALQLRSNTDYRFTVDAREKLMKKNDKIELPDEFLKRWILTTNDKISREDVDKNYGDYRKEFVWELLKDAVLKKYELKVEDEDIRAAGRSLAAARLQQYGLFGLTDEQLDKFAERLLEDKQQFRNLYEKAKEAKVYGAVKEHVKIEDAEISMEDFEKLF